MWTIFFVLVGLILFVKYGLKAIGWMFLLAVLLWAGWHVTLWVSETNVKHLDLPTIKVPAVPKLPTLSNK